MSNLEAILFLTSVAVEKKAISPKETARVLMYLASMAHTYEAVLYENAGPDGACSAEEELASMHAEWTKRFEHLTNVK